MTISLNEIRSRAITFANEYRHDYSEEAEGKTFWNEFFEVFGVHRRRVAIFEHNVEILGGKKGYIDLFWKGVLLVEHKSRGKDLDRAFEQAKDYIPGIKDSELPKYILVSDFDKFRLYNLDDGSQHEFWLVDLPKNIHLFGFMTGHQKQIYPPQDPVNIKAAEMMGRLHDRLKDVEYSGHDLEVYLVRLLFCLFADDTGIFEKNAFREYIETKTNEDGSDLALHLEALFDVLNTPEDKRLKNLDEDLRQFQYVNGSLFEERLRLASFDSIMRQLLIECTMLDWGRISPAIFGSLFQSVMDPDERRALGAHYTEEKNILKVINSLFLGDIKDEFERVKNNNRRLEEFHDKLANLQFLDPACGCGNFLIIAYRELRLLEIEILKRKYEGDHTQQVLDVSHLSKINVDQFFGIEIEEFPAQIAQVAMWLMDHQMNMVLSSTFGLYYTRLPLKTKANILRDNALELDWKDLVRPSDLTYILGNPPFGGSKLLSDKQRREMSLVFRNSKNSGILDYVSAWYVKAGEYIQGTDIKVAFVSTNSITQGEQVGPLWDIMLNRHHVKIFFAHRTFKWSSQARGKAAVHCVIIGFSLNETKKLLLFDYETPEADAHQMNVKHINPYLVDAPDTLLFNRNFPICKVPKIGIGNKPIDGGNYLFSKEEMESFISKEPSSAKWFRPWIGSVEFINGFQRYCLWLGDCPPDELRKMPEALKRVEAVRKLREESDSEPTRKIASTPTRFHVENIPKSSFIVVPKTSSIRRKYIPIGFVSPEVLCGDAVFIIPEATSYHFGILNSSMHMAWVRYVCGRLKSDYRYSVGIVYNNFPWPEPSEQQSSSIERSAQNVLDSRKLFPKSSLADLYDPLTMPKELTQAHNELDTAVEKAYGKRFSSDAERVAFLFERYDSIVGAAPK